MLRSGGNASKLFWITLIMSLILAPLLLCGCESNSPEGAVTKYLNAWQDLDWERYKSSVAPGEQLTEEQQELAKQKFEQIEIATEGLEMKTEYSEDKNKATVVLTGGKISYTAEILGEKKTETQDISKMKEEDKPTFETVKVDDVWYVDRELG